MKYVDDLVAGFLSKLAEEAPKEGEKKKKKEQPSAGQLAWAGAKGGLAGGLAGGLVGPPGAGSLGALGGAAWNIRRRLQKEAEDIGEETPDSVDDGSEEAPKRDEQAKTQTPAAGNRIAKAAKGRRKANQG